MAVFYLLSCLYLFFALLVFIYDSVAREPNDKGFSKFASVSAIIVFVAQTATIITYAVMIQAH